MNSKPKICRSQNQPVVELFVQKYEQWNVSVFEKENRNPILLTWLKTVAANKTGFLVAMRALNKSVYVKTHYEVQWIIAK